MPPNKPKGVFRAEIFVSPKNSDGTQIRRYQRELGLTTYGKAREDVHLLCRAELNSGADMYSFRIKRGDGHQYSMSPWFLFTKKKSWEMYADNRRQGAGLQPEGRQPKDSEAL